MDRRATFGSGGGSVVEIGLGGKAPREGFRVWESPLWSLGWSLVSGLW
jgi:hypothetical protein